MKKKRENKKIEERCGEKKGERIRTEKKELKFEEEKVMKQF